MDDQTVDELGAWGVDYYLNLWEGLYGGAFFRDPGATRSNRELAIEDAESLLGRFCTITTADVSLTAAAPASVAIGNSLRLTFTVANAGPQSVPHVFFATDLPPEVGVTAAAPPGACTVARDAPELGCSLGRLDPGASATVSLAAYVTALPGETIALGPGALVPRVTATARDPRTADDQAPFSVAVTQNPRCPGVPDRGGIVELGTSVGDHLLGTPLRDLLCARGGADILTGLGGSDVLRGGAGADRIEARDRARDAVYCGPGRDTVVADRVDAVARDCERVRRR